MVLCLYGVGCVDNTIFIWKTNNGTKVLLADTNWLYVLEVKVGLVYSCSFVVVSCKNIEALLIRVVDDIMNMSYRPLRIGVDFLYF